MLLINKMETFHEQYFPDATHIWAYQPGSLRTKSAGAYRLFGPSGTWGTTGLTLTRPNKEMTSGMYMSQTQGKSTAAYKVPRYGQITGKEANLLPVGGSIPRVVGSERTEDESTFGNVQNAFNATPKYDRLNYGGRLRDPYATREGTQADPDQPAARRNDMFNRGIQTDAPAPPYA